MSKLKRNFIYLSLYKVLEMLLPMITSPLLSRRLGAEALGIYSYTYSVVSIFSVIAQLGIYNYGMREIAKVRENQKKLNQTYTDIFLTHFITGMIVTGIYILSIFLIGKQNLMVFVIQSVALLANIVDNAFLFVGMENVKAVTTRDAILKFLTFILILIFINEPKDLILYTLIMAVSSFICRFIGLLYGRKYAKFVKPTTSIFKRHFKPMLVLMIPTLASVIYQSMDKIMIKIFYGEVFVGYYECASKALIPRNIITALGTVMCPRVANMYSQNEKSRAKKMIEDSLKISLIMSFVFAFGIASISREFAPWFWGIEFEVCANLMIGLSASIPIWCIGEVIRNQLLIPIGKDKEYLISFAIGVITNGIINALLIPKFGAMGAIIATVIAEIVMSAIQSYYSRKEIRILQCIKEILPYFIFSVIMLICVRIVAKYLNFKNFYNIFIEIIIGIIIFGILSLVYEKVSNNEILSKIIKKEKYNDINNSTGI